MDTLITIEYVAPGGSPQDAEKIAEFMDPDTKLLIPMENQIITLPVEHPIEGPGEHQKDFRGVRGQYAYAGFAPDIAHQPVRILVTDLDE